MKPRILTAAERVAIWHVASQPVVLHRGISVPLRVIKQFSDGASFLKALHSPRRGRRRGGLGRSWTPNLTSARLVALNQGGGIGEDQLVPVTITAEWDGTGRDSATQSTYLDSETRKNKRSEDWPSGEIPLLPKTPLRVTNIRIQHEVAGEFEDFLHEPQEGWA